MLSDPYPRELATEDMSLSTRERAEGFLADSSAEILHSGEPVEGFPGGCVRGVDVSRERAEEDQLETATNTRTASSRNGPLAGARYDQFGTIRPPI